MKRLLLFLPLSILGFDFSKYAELYDNCLFFSKEISLFNDKAAIKVDLPKLLEDYLKWKATEESAALLKDYHDAKKDLSRMRRK